MFKKIPKFILNSIIYFHFFPEIVGHFLYSLAEGIITESDIVGLFAESFQGVSWNHLTVSHVMTSPIISASSDLDLFEALMIARGGNIRHIPVTDENDLIIGVANQTQLIKALVEYSQ